MTGTPPQATEIIAAGLVEYGLDPGVNYYAPERLTEALPAAERLLEAAAPFLAEAARRDQAEHDAQLAGELWGSAFAERLRRGDQP